MDVFFILASAAIAAGCFILWRREAGRAQNLERTAQAERAQAASLLET
jgi:hypothetical protein